MVKSNPHSMVKSLLAFLLFSFVNLASALPTTITVDSTDDFADADGSNFDNYTCTYISGAFYFPAPNNKCTLRRAVVEAGARPDTDRPITIDFNIPTTDPNYDATLGIWEVQIDSHPTSASTAGSEWFLDRDNIFADGGQVTIDGGTRPSGGPAIMINTNTDNNATGGGSLEIYTSNNTIRNLGFHGGGQITLYEGNNLVEKVWMGLTNDGTDMKLASTVDSQAMRGMARGGITMPNADSDFNTIKNNRIIGAAERAIRVTSTGANNNLIQGNKIGMDSDGDVNIAGATIDCTRALDYDSNLWYGGRGIQVLGNNNTIKNNTLAGLHVTQSPGDTPPVSMEIYGTGNLVQNNKVGIDTNGKKVGVCGQGLLFGGTESTAHYNTFYFTRNGYDPNDIDTEFDSAIITQSFITQAMGDPDRWLTVRRNTIDGGDFTEANYHGYRFASPGVNIELRQFIPAKITNISGKAVIGTNGDALFPGVSVEPFCPGCTVYLYLDDIDNRIESHQYMGEGVADENGNWFAYISRPLVAGESLRTQSMTNDNDVIIKSSAVSPTQYYDANTTTRMSDDFYNSSNTTELNPNEVITRRDMVKQILRVINVAPLTATGNVFNDVGMNDINAGYIEKFEDLGYTDGCDANIFCPDAIVTREEMAKFYINILNLDPLFIPDPEEGTFADVTGGLSDNADWIEEMVRKQVTLGCAPNLFCPKAPVTRKWFDELMSTL